MMMPLQVNKKEVGYKDDCNNDSNNDNDKERNMTYNKIYLSSRFVLVTLLLASALSFATGRLCRNMFSHASNPAAVTTTTPSTTTTTTTNFHLPQPVLPKSKQYPNSIYTSRIFDAVGKGANHLSMMARPSEGDGEEELSIPTTEQQVQDDSVHEPSGQHLMVDLEHINQEFLSSEQRLAEAMIDLVNLSGLTMLSYHCNVFQPAGTSCIGVLLESHVSLHARPASGVIMIDLFTCGPKSLEALLPDIQELFGIPQTGQHEDSATETMVEPPRMVSIYKKRGFQFPPREQEESSAATTHQDVDIDAQALGSPDLLQQTRPTPQTSWQNSNQLYQPPVLSQNWSYDENHPEPSTPTVTFESAPAMALSSLSKVSQQHGDEVIRPVLSSSNAAAAVVTDVTYGASVST